MPRDVTPKKAESGPKPNDPAEGGPDQTAKERSPPKPRPAPDPFYRDSVFPDPVAIFSFAPQLIEEAKKDCLVVIDTNVLLLPYKSGKDALAAIRPVLTRLSQEKRLFIPSQVAREFAAHRFDHIRMMLETWHDIHSKVPNVEGLQSFASLEEMPEYKTAKDAAARIRADAKAYSDAIGAIKTKIESWMLTDPVSTLYREIFNQENVIEIPLEKATLLDEYRHRLELRIPPGFEDGERIGDYIIWKCILHLAGTHKKSLIFVTGDSKIDWVHKTKYNQVLFPRLELVDEYRRASGDKTFFLLQLSGF